MAQEVLIEFIADYTSLDKAIDVLEKTGQVDSKLAQSFKSTNAEIGKQAQALKKTADAAKAPTQSIEQLDKKTREFVKNFIDGIQQGINEELKRAKPEIDAFRKKLEEAGAKGKTATTSLKQELRQLTEEIAKAKASGGPIDTNMIKRAGELKDAIADANAEIKNAGSDTRNIDNVVGSISALAGGFAAVQGAAGLFTDESEELQKVLLKVNSAMALATGIQQVANAVQKEGSLAKLADVAATNIQIAVQKVYTFVTGQATAATTAFKIALATTGIGLFVVGLLAVVSALQDTEEGIEDNIDALKRLDAAEREASLSFINDAERRELATAKTEAEIFEIRQKFGRLRIQTLKRTNAEAEDIRDAETDQFVRDEEYKKSLYEKRLQKQKEADEKALQRARELRAAEFADFKAQQELKILQATKGSDEELAARKSLLRAELLINLENEKLTNNQRKVLIQQFFKDRLQLEKDFRKARNEQIFGEIASDLNNELQQINLSNERKLELTESLIAIQAALEVEAANGNAAKIEEINAKRDRAILEARKASILEAANYEASLNTANNGGAQRALQRVLNDEKQKLDVRLNALDQIEAAELESINKRLDTNQKLFDEGLISQQEFQLTETQLLDERNKVWEEKEQQRVDITDKANNKIRENNIRFIQDTISVLSQVVDVMNSLFDLQAAKENEKLNEQKRKLQELTEAGAITEKEAIIRQKRLEAEERRARQQQAQRDKQIAVFKSLLAIPQAFLQGLSQGGPILAAIYGALAAAQAAIVISRPVPKFATGKKGNYQGPGIMGEAGAELIQRADGSMHIATKPTLIYVGAKDKIFTAGETKRMLPSVDKSLMREKEQGSHIDYEKLAQAIVRSYKPSKMPNVNIDNSEVGQETVNALLKANYFDRYYKS